VNIADYPTPHHTRFTVNLYRNRKVEKTSKGYRYVLLQDAPNSIHLTIQDGDKAIYDHLANLQSEEDLNNRISTLETEFTAWVTKNEAIS
jgi:hypothetical protein